MSERAHAICWLVGPSCGELRGEGRRRLAILSVRAKRAGPLPPLPIPLAPPAYLPLPTCLPLPACLPRLQIMVPFQALQMVGFQVSRTPSAARPIAP